MQASLVIGDIIRWTIGLVLAYFLLSYSLVGIFYIFEFLVTKFEHLDWLLYILTWTFVLPTIIVLLVRVFAWILTQATRLIRQRSAFTHIMAVLMALGILTILIMFWTGYLEFSWENYEHKILNNLLFTVFLLSMLLIPVQIGTTAIVAEQSVSKG